MNAGHEHNGRGPDPHGNHGLGHHLRSMAGFWRSAINDHVVATAEIGPGEVVLDIGAGMGPATIPAAHRGASVTAVDPSRFMRSALRLRRLWQRARRRIRVVPGVAERLPLEDHSIDVAVAVNAMHHWTDMDAAVHELRRVLRPGGRLVLVDEDFDDSAHVMARSSGTHNMTFPMIDPEEVAASLAAAGFAARPRRIAVAGRPILEVVAHAPR